jgi:hypothetical protein
MTVTNHVTDDGVVVLPVAEEGFLALGAHEVLHVPVLPQCRHHSLLNRPPKAQEKNCNLLIPRIWIFSFN